MPNNRQASFKSSKPPSTIKKSLKSTAFKSEDEECVGLDDIKKLHSDIKNSWKIVQKGRYKNIGSYKSDRWIWNGAILIIFFWLWFIAQSYDYNLDYYKCGGDEPRLYEGAHQVCKNPFYKPENTWKNQEFLPPGEYGQKPGGLFNSAGPVAIITLLLAGLLNHTIHNRRRKT